MAITPLYETKLADLLISVYRTNEELGTAAAEEAAAVIRHAVEARDSANLIVATGNSQLTF